jgi:ubiquinone/menaquinone biosynthesis C-methylase UbiE
VSVSPLFEAREEFTMKRPQTEIEASYDRVAEHFADEYFEEFKRKPFDRELLDQFAASVRDRGLVCDLGCGPGQIARYLRDRGVAACGIDLSSEMLNCARRLNPDISFDQGNMLALNVPDASFVAIVSFYAIIHLRRDQAPRALKELHRVLQPGGKLLLAFHGGEGELHRDEWYGKPVSIFVTLFESQEMTDYLTAAGFEIEQVAERDHYSFEYPTRRVYILGRKPSL